MVVGVVVVAKKFVVGCVVPNFGFDFGFGCAAAAVAAVGS